MEIIPKPIPALDPGRQCQNQEGSGPLEGAGPPQEFNDSPSNWKKVENEKRQTQQKDEEKGNEMQKNEKTN